MGLAASGGVALRRIVPEQMYRVGRVAMVDVISGLAVGDIVLPAAGADLGHDWPQAPPWVLRAG